MKIIYALIPLCLLSSCKQSSQPADGQGDVAPNTQEEEQVSSPEMTTPEEVAKDQEVKSEIPSAVQPKGDSRYIGMTREGAMAMAKKEGTPSRVVSVDGEAGIVTLDHRPDRLNFTVVAGKVTKVTRG